MLQPETLMQSRSGNVLETQHLQILRFCWYLRIGKFVVQIISLHLQIGWHKFMICLVALDDRVFHRVKILRMPSALQIQSDEWELDGS